MYVSRCKFGYHFVGFEPWPKTSDVLPTPLPPHRFELLQKSRELCHGAQKTKRC
jgi:hypothetical protein